MSEIISRSEARVLGLTHYFTGVPCKRGHVAKRLVSIAGCVECKKEVQRAYVAAHPEKILTYWSVNRDREKINATERARYAANAEKVRAKNRAQYQADPAKARARTAAYFKANPHKNAAQAQKRRAAKLRAIPNWIDPEFEAFALEEATQLSCLRAEIFGFRWAVDHMIPLRAKDATGLHVASNFQVIPFRINASKGNKMVYLTPGAWLEGAC